MRGGQSFKTQFDISIGTSDVVFVFPCGNCWIKSGFDLKRFWNGLSQISQLISNYTRFLFHFHIHCPFPNFKGYFEPDCYLMVCLISNLIHMHYSARTHIPLASQLFLSPGWSRNIPRKLGDTMGLLPDTWNCGLRMHRECRERFPRHRLQRKLLVSDPGMHHDACRDHWPAVAG